MADDLVIPKPDVVQPVQPEVLQPTQVPAQRPTQPAPQTLSPVAPSGPVLQAVPCCWCKKFETDVSEHGSTYVLATQHPNHAVLFRLTVDFVGGVVTVSRVLKWGTVASTVTAAEQTAVQTGLTSGVAGIWSNKFKLEVTDTSCVPSKKTFPIRFEVLWDTSTPRPADLNVNLVKGPARSSASGVNMSLDTLDVANGNYTLAHEYGHTFGLVDEYSYGGTGPISADYHRADGTTTNITIPQSGNMMSTARSMTMLDRFYWFIEIEAQKLLRSSNGVGRAGITCKIV